MRRGPRGAGRHRRLAAPSVDAAAGETVHAHQMGESGRFDGGDAGWASGNLQLVSHGPAAWLVLAPPTEAWAEKAVAFFTESHVDTKFPLSEIAGKAHSISFRFRLDYPN